MVTLQTKQTSYPIMICDESSRYVYFNIYRHFKDFILDFPYTILNLITIKTVKLTTPLIEDLSNSLYKFMCPYIFLIFRKCSFEDDFRNGSNTMKNGPNKCNSVCRITWIDTGHSISSYFGFIRFQ